MRWAYLGLLLLQPLWHAFLPEPMGSRSGALAVVATLPLLVPLRGVMKRSLRTLIWAGYLLMLYLIVGVMEAWANPPQRIPALIQVALVAAYTGGVLAFSRRGGSQAPGPPPESPAGPAKRNTPGKPR